MGFIDDKRDIFNEIGALTSIKDEQNLPNPKDSLSSINNSKEVVPFMLDMLTVLVGSEALKELTGELMTDFVRNVEPTLKTGLTSQLTTFNSNATLPSGFVGGYSVSASSVDNFSKLKTDPATQTGSLLYPVDVNNFDKKSYEAITNAGTETTYNNVTIEYDESFDEFIYKPVTPSQTIGDFIETYVDGLVLIDEKVFTTTLLNNLFGTITNNQNKTVSTAFMEEKINATIEKIIKNEDDITISNSELFALENAANEKVNGTYLLDVGCGELTSTVTLDDIDNLLNITTGSTDPLVVGNAFNDIMGNSFSDAQSTQAQEDNQTIKDGFFKKLINAIVNALVSSITVTPQIRALFAITSAFKNNDIPVIGDPVDDLNNKQDLIVCLSNSAKSTIHEFIFNMVKKELLELVVPVSKIILKEKINQYLRILKSLIPFGS